MSDAAKVRELAQLALISDRISEFHEKNLNAFPFIFFNGVTETKIEYDLQKGSKNHVTYRLTVKEGSENPQLAKRLESLDKAIKHLFWNDVHVLVYSNDEKIYESTLSTATKVMDNNKNV